MKYISCFLACLATLWLTCLIFPQQAGYSSLGFLWLAALVLSLLYRFIRPLLQLAGSPISLITCGLFVFVINGGLIKLASVLVGGFWFNGFWLCLGAALLIGIIDGFVGCIVKPQQKYY